MATTSSESLDLLYRALAHPTRRELLQSLVTGECDVTVLQESSGKEQPVVSKHLAVLREAGLVSVRHDGRRRCYTLRSPRIVSQLLQLAQWATVPDAQGEDLSCD